MNPAPALDQPFSLVLGLALLGLLPFAFMSLTSFVKISTVLQITKSAIGAQSVPSNTVIMALSAALTLLAMAPVGERISGGVAAALHSDKPTVELATDVFEATAEPLRSFLTANASPRETQRFLRLAKTARPADTRDQVTKEDFAVIIPAFMISELIEAFALGFAIFLPFLVIDIVVGNVLMALGMQMMNPTQVSLPFKLLLFVAADGWGLLAQALVTGYQSG
jgi:type III secretion protein R